MTALDHTLALLRDWGQEVSVQPHFAFCMIDGVPGGTWTLLRLADGSALRTYRGPSDQLGPLLRQLAPQLVILQQQAPPVNWSALSNLHPPLVPSAARRNARTDPLIHTLEEQLRRQFAAALTTVLFTETFGNTYFSLCLTMERLNVVLEVHTPSLNLSCEVSPGQAGALITRVTPLMIDIQTAIEDRARATRLPDALSAQLDLMARRVTDAGTLLSVTPHEDADVQVDAYATAQGTVMRLRDGRVDIVTRLDAGKLERTFLDVLTLMPDSAHFPPNYGDEYPLGDTSDPLHLPPTRGTPAVRAWRRDTEQLIAELDTDHHRFMTSAARLVAYHSEGEWTLSLYDGASLHRTVVQAGDYDAAALFARSIDRLTDLLRRPVTPDA
ncbi:hypothetical protein [Deinococcus soli (ex Cha et al. 2016)]|uniref:Uncharacterized protein n=2 Tax=Deinococcus soli (ex Cha et al. 2016) TaxID=1309411 RepID=A0ACC6KFH2_9DEIO|nr:hypothetical protein [Deinococcus soli (ex Cha et al. 2016)]MDR6218223.1 hypothetical protein [Deinococcus soli (ex Cha et al. 2016)]MDR6328963.1 hypothetical protein [Deinococcus soli (ex Cha et al. 2016)]MDR6751236.1 hypothetical protein [Deinococcus soli (ex Cha et al. 2016)]